MIVGHMEGGDFGDAASIPTTTLISPTNGSALPASKKYWLFGDLTVTVTLKLINQTSYSYFNISYQLIEESFPQGKTLNQAITLYSGESADLSTDLSLGNQNLAGTETARLVITIQPLYTPTQAALEATVVADITFAITN